MDKVEKRRAFLINFAFVAVILALAFVGLKYFFWVAAPFLLSFFFAVLLQKPLRFLDKKTKHKAHGLLSVVLVILSICVIIVPLSFLISALINKISEFLNFLLEQLNDLPSFLATLENWLLNFCGFLPEHLYKSVSASITEWFTNFSRMLPRRQVLCRVCFRALI